MIGNEPYSNKELFQKYRELIYTFGMTAVTEIPGWALYNICRDHHIMRQLVTWNFLESTLGKNVHAYEEGIFLGDIDSIYKVTDTVRAFCKLNPQDNYDLGKGILMLLKADCSAEVRQGLRVVSSRMIGFYELVVLLNRSENAIFQSLLRLEEMNLISMTIRNDDNIIPKHRSYNIHIKNEGMFFLEKEVTLMINNIKIDNSPGAIVAINSTLSNIERDLQQVKQDGYKELAHVLEELVHLVTECDINVSEKENIINNIGTIINGIKGKDRRSSDQIRKSIDFLQSTLANFANVATIWSIAVPVIKTFFGMI